MCQQRAKPSCRCRLVGTALPVDFFLPQKFWLLDKLQKHCYKGCIRFLKGLFLLTWLFQRGKDIYVVARQVWSQQI